MAHVVWTERAADEVEAVQSYVAADNPRAADALVQRIKAAGEDLVLFPYCGRPVRQGVRELTIVRPYVIRYRVSGDIVTILRVRHGARRPT